MTIIVGIDPGSRKTGFGVIETLKGQHIYIASGVIRLPDAPLPERLQVIFESVTEVINEYLPTQMAIEQVFMAKNPNSALILGQARGAAIVAATNQQLSVAEYEAKKVKQSVVGNGGAEKSQVQHMVKQILRLSAVPQEDAADALAVALCHANSQQHLNMVAKANHFRRGRMV